MYTIFHSYENVRRTSVCSQVCMNICIHMSVSIYANVYACVHAFGLVWGLWEPVNRDNSTIPYFTSLYYLFNPHLIANKLTPERYEGTPVSILYTTDQSSPTATGEVGRG